MSLFYISSWLTLKKTRVILQDVVRLMSSVQLQNCKNYTVRLEASGRTIIARAIFGNTSVHGRFIARAKSIHWKACKTKAVFLAYAKNAFHSINRKASLHLTYQLRVLYYQHLCQTATEFQRDSLFWGKN